MHADQLLRITMPGRNALLSARPDVRAAVRSGHDYVASVKRECRCHGDTPFTYIPPSPVSYCWELRWSGRADWQLKRTTIGRVGMLAVIAGTVSHLHMHLLVELHGNRAGSRR
jgi:hypothetical protein